MKAINKINYTYLENTFGGNEEIITKILTCFIDSTPPILKKLNESITNHEWNQVQLIAHKAKSCFQIVGGKEIGAMLEKIETLDISTHKDEIINLVTEITTLSNLFFTATALSIKKNYIDEDIKILAVDDSELERIKLQFLLESTYKKENIFIANTIENAWEILTNNKIDIALIDIYLPGENGADLINNMLADDIYKKIPIIVITGTHKDSFVKASFEKYVFSYLHKPFDKNELLKTMKKCVA